MSVNDQDTYIDLATLRLADGACEALATRCEGYGAHSRA